MIITSLTIVLDTYILYIYIYIYYIYVSMKKMVLLFMITLTWKWNYGSIVLPRDYHIYPIGKWMVFWRYNNAL